MKVKRSPFFHFRHFLFLIQVSKESAIKLYGQVKPTENAVQVNSISLTILLSYRQESVK